MNKKIKKILTLFSPVFVIGLVVSTVVCNNENSVLFKSIASNNEEWIHYSAVEPTKTKAGIKGYYVNCITHSHSFNAPTSFTEGSWNSEKQNAILSNPNDDRYIKSFNEVDDLLDDITGVDPFDFVEIDSAEKYLLNNYSSSSLALYKSESNLVYDYKDAYETCNSTILDMNSVSFYANNAAFTVNKGNDSLYGNTLNISFNSNVTSGSNPSFDINNMSYLSNEYGSISFAIYASEQTEITLGVIYDNWSGGGTYFFAKSLNIGWNHYTFNVGSSEYNTLTTSPDGSKAFTSMQVVLTGNHSQNSVIKLGSYNGFRQGNALSNKIAKLPSAENLTPYSIGILTNLYNQYLSLTSAEQACVTNISVLNGLISAWNSKYVLLYDMNASYADFTGNATLDESTVFDSDVGYARLVNVSVAGTYLDINNINNAVTSSELSEIVYMIKPSQDCFMSWSQIGNYGRREWDNGVKCPDMIMQGNTWNEYKINGTIAGVSSISSFLTYFSEHTSARNDFTTTSDRWNGYLIKVAGFSFQMSSIIGIKDNTSTVTSLISRINNLPDASSMNISYSNELNQIDSIFESLPTASKELITNINKYYECADALSCTEAYIASPSLTLDSPWQTGCVSSSNIQNNVSTDYGKAYYFTAAQDNWGLNLRLFTGTLPTDSCDFYFYIKNFSKTISLGYDAYGSSVATAVGESVGSNWYKFSFTSSTYQTLQTNLTNYLLITLNPQAPTSGKIASGTEIYISGIFKHATSNATQKALVQSEINNLLDSSIDEFSLPTISKVQADIYSLSTLDQSSLSNAYQVGNYYENYNETYKKAYSTNVYSVGKYDSSSCGNITKTTDAVYGDIYEIVNKTGSKNTFTLGVWEMKSYTGNFRGNGRAIKPLESGRYLSVKFGLYAPASTTLELAGYSASDTKTSILTRSISSGWNIISLSSSELSILCGSSANFTGLAFILNSTSTSGSYKLTSFIGKLNPSFTGEAYHYSQTSVHENIDNIESSNIPLVIGGKSTYKLDSNNSSIAADAIGFFEDEIFSTTGVNFDEENGLNPSTLSRHIYFDNPSVMSTMGISVPSITEIGESGYIIKSVGSSIYVFAYGSKGYRLAAIKLLEAIIGYDYMSEDCSTSIKNGQSLKGTETLYLPLFDVKEIPDFINRYASNTLSYAQYGSGLDNRTTLYSSAGCNVYDYLPTDTYSSCYYEITYDSTLNINGSILCFNAKGNTTLRNTMIQVIGDKIIQNAKDYPGNAFYAVLQGDSSKHCNCSTCTSQKNTYGQYSACDILFMNDLDTYIKGHYSRNIKICFMAYNATQYAPTGLMCHDDVVPVVAPIGCRWNHSFYEEENSSAKGENGYKYDNDFAQIMMDWDACSSEYITYAYQIGNANFLFPYNTFDSIFDQYRFFHNNGSSSMSNEGNWCDAGSGFIALKDYLDSKALVNVNGDFDEYYEKFFSSYYGAAGPYMQQLFDECVNAVDFLAEEYGRGANYDPTSHATSTGSIVKTYYYDGSIGINDNIDFSKFWNNAGDCYNGSKGGNGKNIANISRWVSLCNSAIAAVQSSDPVAYKHVKRECIFVYYANYQFNSDSTYNSTLCQYSFDVGTYWYSEAFARTDSYNGLDGTNTICYQLLGKTYRQQYMG